jgi:hypothetical protein
MATDEDQPQHVVVDHRRVVRLIAGPRIKLDLVRDSLLPVAKRDLAADAVDRLVASDIDQPGARIGRRFILGPALQCHREGVLQRVLGRSKSPTRRISVASARPASSRNIFSMSMGVMLGKLLNSVIPGRPKDEPGISRFRVWSYGPSRNDGLCHHLL